MATILETMKLLHPKHEFAFYLFYFVLLIELLFFSVKHVGAGTQVRFPVAFSVSMSSKRCSSGCMYFLEATVNDYCSPYITVRYPYAVDSL